MKNKSFAVLALILLSAFNSQFNTARAQGTAFTYQGQLQSSGSPATGLYDFVFSLSNAPSGGSQVGGSVTNLAVGVTNGLFTTTLNFGAVFTGNATWLAISVRTNGTGGYAGLTPLQQLTPTPYAIFAGTASNVSGTVSAAQLSGTVPLAQLPAAVVTNNQTSVGLNNLTNSGNLYLPATTATVGSIYFGGIPFIHAYGVNDFFAGSGAGNFTTTGNQNTGVGYQALHTIGSGSDNTALGFYAMVNGTGNYNTALGWEAMIYNSGAYNTAVGYGTLAATFLSGSDNTAVGSAALAGNTTGTENTGNGFYALNANTTGSFNSANGSRTLNDNGAGSYNTANGYSALYNNRSGSNNTANGSASLQSNTTGNNNTADGYQALYTTTTGGTNIALGNNAGYNITGSFNIDIGNLGVGTDTNIIRIGSGQTQAFIAGVITGNGGGLTNLNTANFSGPVSLAQLPGAVVTNNESGLTLTGTFTGNGAGLTNLNLSQLPNGVVTNFETGVTLTNLNVGGNLNLPLPAIIYAGSNTLVYADTNFNFWAGQSAGNLTNVSYDNTAIGAVALSVNTNHDNTAIGAYALWQNTSGYANTAIGAGALGYNTNGIYNTAIGFNALHGNTSGIYNTAVGALTLGQNESGSFNTTVGMFSLLYDTTGSYNTANGFNALDRNESGSDNTANGNMALFYNFNGGANTAIGEGALFLNTSGSTNIALGYQAGYNITNSFNIDIGNMGLATDTNIIRIGDGQTDTYLAGTVHVAGMDIASSGGLDSPQLLLSQQADDFVRLRFAPYTYTPWDIAVKTVMNFYASGGANGGNVMSLATNGNLTVAGTVTANGVLLTSDRNAKENFTAVNARDVLARVAALPVTEWNYKTDSKAQPHIGPMAKDFQAAFQLGTDDKHISVVDENGVALAAIQGLNQKLEDSSQNSEVRIQKLETENADLKQRLDALEKLILNQKQN